MKTKLLAPLVAIAFGVGVWVWWLQGGFGGPVSDEAARSYFARIVAAAQAKDFETLCRLSASVGTCEAELHTYCPENVPAGPSGPVFPSGEVLERLCRESVPSGPPKIVSSTHRPGRDGYVGGRLLLIKGTDGRGDPYETEVLIFRDKRSYKATHAVFWSGSKFPVDRTSAKPEPPE
jgi:hypothetical protein